MNITYPSKKLDLLFVFEASDIKDGFDQVANIQEIFEPEKCGKCGNTENFKLSRRDVSQGKKTFTYREIVCTKCFHRLALGQKLADQSLFPQRNDKDGNPKPNHGWTKFEAQPDVAE